MDKRNIVFIGRSLDGYIADKKGGLDWLQATPNPDQIDMGYKKFMSQVDAIVMGRITFETVCNFDCDWPYTIPVFVISNTIESIPDDYKEKAALVKGSLSEVLKTIHQKGYNQLYIDGGKTIQEFLKEDLIDELIITTIPILLGGGSPLFSELPKELKFEHVASNVFLNEVVQNHYSRKR
ncbi:dihydrofolate reductase family protein [Flavivirga jejuensis]|uniref:Dihydrofolate reductase family protein n=1 Tax=Flavivirga jejuensis TaxID=870487 RepID=A0ABT8WHJ9_9FLAO|nr:dihydrofolate reductase family protein [Flavivirga jejuensis]MDO5972636.1 dihydrofolate reductase family protein [Flavivirga jejuensis]